MLILSGRAHHLARLARSARRAVGRMDAYKILASGKARQVVAGGFSPPYPRLPALW